MKTISLSLRMLEIYSFTIYGVNVALPIHTSYNNVRQRYFYSIQIFNGTPRKITVLHFR